MTVEIDTANIKVEVIRLESDIIEDHLQCTSSVLHDILREEINLENEQTGHACQQCRKFYKTLKTLQSHMMLKHPKNEEAVPCTVCGKNYSSLMSLRKHVQYMHRYKHRCKACYRTFATPEILACHSVSCHNNVCPCPVCHKVFDSRLALRNHINYNHPNSVKSFISERQCKLCRRTFTSSRTLTNHMAAIHPTGKSECRLCSRNFNSVAALRSHYLYKHVGNSVRCNKCHKLFVSNQSLYRHMNKIHGDNHHGYWCGMCKMPFYKSSDLVNHVMETHEDLNC